MTISTPSKAELKRIVRGLEAERLKIEARLEHFSALLDLEGGEEKAPKRKKRTKTVEFEEKVKTIFSQNEYKPLGLQSILTSIVALYPDGSMTEEKARNKAISLYRSGFLISKERGIYELAETFRQNKTLQ